MIGATMQQVVRRHDPGQVIAIDVLPMRCEIARALGADEVIDGSEADAAQAVRELTDGAGARVVIEAIGGSLSESPEKHPARPAESRRLRMNSAVRRRPCMDEGGSPAGFDLVPPWAREGRS